MRILIPFVGLIALTACGVEAAPAEFADILPDSRVEVNLPIEASGTARVDNWSQFYLLTASVTDDVNGLIGSVLVTIDTVTDLPPTWHDTEDNTAAWGPFSDALDPVETALWVHYEESTDTYTWMVVQKPKNDDTEDWVAVIAGQVDPGATADYSSGYFAMDFTLAQTLDPTRTASGTFACEYDIAEDGVTATALFDDFSDGGETVDAVYVYDQTHGGDGRLDFAFLINVNPGEGADLDETALLRSRWLQTGEGRSDAYVTQGDLGETVATASECWDDTFELVYSTNNYGLDQDVGDVGLCAWAQPEFNEEEDPNAR